MKLDESKKSDLANPAKPDFACLGTDDNGSHGGLMVTGYDAANAQNDHQKAWEPKFIDEFKDMWVAIMQHGYFAHKKGQDISPIVADVLRMGPENIKKRFIKSWMI